MVPPLPAGFPPRIWSATRAALLVACVASFRSAAAEPTAEELAVQAAAAFKKLDVAPRDEVLSGDELATVPGYDRDGDGRVTPEEFARGYLEKKPVAEWQRHEFKRQGFACEMPGAPEPLDSAGMAHFQVAVDAVAPAVLYVARVRDMPARAARKAGAFFDTVAESLEASGARVVERRAADLGLHRGCIVAARREDGTLEVVRSVVVGQMVYELHAILPPDADAPALEAVNRFLSSLRLTR